MPTMPNFSDAIGTRTIFAEIIGTDVVEKDYPSGKKNVPIVKLKCLHLVDGKHCGTIYAKELALWKIKASQGCSVHSDIVRRKNQSEGQRKLNKIVNSKPVAPKKEEKKIAAPAPKQTPASGLQDAIYLALGREQEISFKYEGVQVTLRGSIVDINKLAQKLREAK